MIEHRALLWRQINKHFFPLTYPLQNELNWEKVAADLTNPALSYPAYYLVPHHGLAEGYLSPRQPVVWELIERLSCIPRTRPILLQQALAGTPGSIVDLGCGTATTSLQLAHFLPQAHFHLIDLSPYALAAAQWQAQRNGVLQQVSCIHALAEATGLPSAQTDLVLTCLLFHELPRPATQAVLREAWRLLRPGGRLLIFDAIQQAFPWPWFDAYFNRGLGSMLHEVYWSDYMALPLWKLCQEMGFCKVERRLLPVLPWIYQLISVIK
ncbi:class I SAM-dependent methyltransferase [Tengunoibacter tsumagoiensis]|uniref:Methyltransferase type 11 n=1 Tax=Tengunoibacter tsumagoiensis TaxID=2014871 RepID=A0A402AAZ2_9CHLR|nr:class I SAM-dependent methyltransferase [Tengunoibacter tsumagoiensis]GCE16125.1 methyltransferase type 11 [Tengunoibacter tsumagoiensis]